MDAASSPPPAAYDDLRAVFVNCTLKRSPELSHTEGLLQRSMALMASQGVSVDSIRLVDHPVASGVYPDMREHGWEQDAWPELWPRIERAQILVVGTPIWLGEVGPGPSYLDDGSGGSQNDFTNRNTTFMTWNLLHQARALTDAGGVPAYGNLRQQWNEGERWGFDANPEYR